MQAQVSSYYFVTVGSGLSGLIIDSGLARVLTIKEKVFYIARHGVIIVLFSPVPHVDNQQEDDNQDVEEHGWRTALIFTSGNTVVKHTRRRCFAHYKSLGSLI